MPRSRAQPPAPLDQPIADVLRELAAMVGKAKRWKRGEIGKSQRRLQLLRTAALRAELNGGKAVVRRYRRRKRHARAPQLPLGTMK